MPTLVAFASLPFGLREGQHEMMTAEGPLLVHISAMRYNPFLSITSRPELAQAIPASGRGDGLTSYTWYDHPFVLRVLFGRNVASLGSLNSTATVLQSLPAELTLDDASALEKLREDLARVTLTALNNLIGVVRHRARLYHISDLRREDLDVTVRDSQGGILSDDPVQEALARAEAQQGEEFDLVERDAAWYGALYDDLRDAEPISLADDLLMEAERALRQRFPRQAIATCHTALEIGSSALLTRGMRRRGVPDAEIDEVLATKSLSSKLDPLLLKYTGTSLRRFNHPLWEGVTAVNELRNDIVHRGRTPSDADAERALATTREVLQWLDLLRGRNKGGPAAA